MRSYDPAALQSDGIAQKPATVPLIVDLEKHIGNARAWCDTFGEQLSDLKIRIWPDAGNLVVRIRHLVPFDRIEIPRKLSDPKGTIC